MTRQVVVIIPTLNEAAHIAGLLSQFGRQPAALVVEILVADGGSTDGTRALVEHAATRDPRIRLVDNRARIQSAGINRAVALADRRADTIVRVDAHARYPDDYVPRLIAAFEATGADMVAVVLDTIGTTCLQRGIAAASNSRIGTGGSAHRMGGTSGWVDHGHHAGMDRAMFEAVGGYDESFVANEDAEFDLRVRRAGGRIWLLAELAIGYAPRATLAGLFRQYYRYGQGRASTFLKHGERLRARQMIPPVLVVALIVSVLLAPAWPIFLGVPLLYFGALGIVAAGIATREHSRCALISAPAAATMHVAWGLGFILTLLYRPRRRSSGQGMEWQASIPASKNEARR